ncbi:hypothetical protein JW859_09445 [bacterium]|nr:hypothetical protein [bacterium]
MSAERKQKDEWASGAKSPAAYNTRQLEIVILNQFSTVSPEVADLNLPPFGFAYIP